MARMRMLLTLSACVSVIVAQSFTVPSSWRKPAAEHSLDDLERIAQAADDAFKPLYNSTSGQLDMTENASTFYEVDAIAYSALARKDLFAGTQSNKWVVDAIKTSNQTSQGFIFHAEWGVSWLSMYLGIAAVDGYKAYKDPQLLQIAQEAWDYSAKYMITEDQAKAGHHPAKSDGFVSACENKTIAGAVFWNTTFTGDMYILSDPVGKFAILSTRLAELEGSEGRNNTKYKTAAVLVGNFLLNHMVDPVSLLVHQSLIINGVDACTPGAGSPFRSTGNIIETFAILADLTGDSKWTDMLSKVIPRVTGPGSWTSQSGIFLADRYYSDSQLDQSSKGFFVANFYEAWTRTKNNDMKKFIEAYVNVQNNAILDLATSNSSGFYSSHWEGPAATSFEVAGTTAAANVFSFGIAIGKQPASAPSSTTQKPSSASSSALTSTETTKNNLAAPRNHASLAGCIASATLLCVLLGELW